MSTSEEYLCKSANGKRIVFDTVNSHTASHFADAPNLRELVTDILRKERLEDPIVAHDVDVGKVVGLTDVVEVGERDKVVYAMRKNHAEQGYVPFTKSQSSQPSSLVSFYLLKRDASTYELASTWIGAYETPDFPQMESATKGSISYWRNHAFTWGSQAIIPGTELSDCPW
jgi:hypothetical protein